MKSYLQSGQLDLENLPDGKQMKGLVVGYIICQIFLLNQSGVQQLFLINSFLKNTKPCWTKFL